MSASRGEGGDGTCADFVPLAWIPKPEISKLNLWEGDRIFLKLLLEDKGMFSMKLTYRGDELVDVVTEVY